jgi:hypothetical protein
VPVVHIHDGLLNSILEHRPAGGDSFAAASANECIVCGKQREPRMDKVCKVLPGRQLPATLNVDSPVSWNVIRQNEELSTARAGYSGPQVIKLGGEGHATVWKPKFVQIDKRLPALNVNTHGRGPIDALAGNKAASTPSALRVMVANCRQGTPSRRGNRHNIPHRVPIDRALKICLS